jgi:hypothetical protein
MDALEDRAPGEASGRAGGAAARCPSPPRGALDGIRKDHLRAKAARAAGETLKAGAAWSNGAARLAAWCMWHGIAACCVRCCARRVRALAAARMLFAQPYLQRAL